MKLTKMSEFAMTLLPAMAHLDRPVKAGELSERTGVPLTYTQIILRKLCRGKVVTSERGRSGGYRLAAGAGEIRVMRIVEMLEGKPFTAASTRPKMVQKVNAVLGRSVEDGLTMTVQDLFDCYRQEPVQTG